VLAIPRIVFVTKITPPDIAPDIIAGMKLSLRSVLEKVEY
jgi:hypothetical protein